MDAFTIGWLFWIIAFVVIEGMALVTRTPGGTLSEHVWGWFAVVQRGTPPDAWTRTRRIFLLGFMAWLTVHFLTGGQYV